MYDLRTRLALAGELTPAFLAGRWTAEEAAERGAGCLDRWPDWMSALAFELVGAYPQAPLDRPKLVTDAIQSFLAQRSVGHGRSDPPQIIRLLVAVPAPESRQRRAVWPVVAIESPAVLAELLELSDGHLSWLADTRALEQSVAVAKLRNYRYRVVPRRQGMPRVIESPKARLKEVQRWILREILDHIPAHECAHGFVRGRSVITHAHRHTEQAAILRLDLKDFFPSVRGGRIDAIFRALGYAPRVAHILTGLCTNTVPSVLWHLIPPPASSALVAPHFQLGRQLATPHLPQGAPTSPALANLAAFGLDRRLAGLAQSRELRYTRYADDLTFSGDRALGRQSAGLLALVAEIARDEGFTINRDKSRLRTSANRQVVCGVVVNAHPNVARTEYDRLKAILHNVARDGPASHNRAGVPDLRAHLRGRIDWVAALNPRHGDALRARFAAIDWSSPDD